MVSESQRPTGGGGLSPLNATVDALNLVKSISSITPAKAVFGSASDLLVTIRVRFPTCYDELLIHLYLGLYGQ